MSASVADFRAIWDEKPPEGWTEADMDVLLAYWEEKSWNPFDRSMRARWDESDPDGVWIWEREVEWETRTLHRDYIRASAKDIPDILAMLGSGPDDRTEHSRKLVRLSSLFRERMGFVVVVTEVEG